MHLQTTAGFGSCLGRWLCWTSRSVSAYPTFTKLKTMMTKNSTFWNKQRKASCAFWNKQLISTILWLGQPIKYGLFYSKQAFSHVFKFLCKTRKTHSHNTKHLAPDPPKYRVSIYVKIVLQCFLSIPKQIILLLLILQLNQIE